jgi:predicted DNA-binding transcriptional regulator YafY
MSNLHRLAWIDARIREKSYPGSRIIAEKFEISVRQAQRDMEYLKYSMGAPLEYSSIRKGYYYTDEAFALPAHFITGEEKRILTYLASQYKITRGGNAELLAGLFLRLSGDNADGESCASDVPVYSAGTEEITAYETFKKAIKTNKKVKFQYRNSKYELSERVFHPYKLFNKEKVNYAAGFCELRSEIRVFRLSRTSRPQITEESFQVLKHFNEKNYGPERGFVFKEPYSAVIEFDKPVETDKFKLQVVPVSNKTYKISFYNSDEILSGLLSQALGFSIISPKWLKVKLSERLNKIIMKNI